MSIDLLLCTLNIASAKIFEHVRYSTFDDLFFISIESLVINFFSFDFSIFSYASPDMGGSKRAYAYSKFLGTDVVICYKQRSKGNVITHMELIGDVTGKNVILIDDMVDTAGTLTKAADLMIEKGAESVIAICTHALLSGDAYAKIEKSKLKKLITSDSIEIKNKSKKVEHLTCSKIFAEAMFNVHNNKSIDKLFIN